MRVRAAVLAAGILVGLTATPALAADTAPGSPARASHPPLLHVGARVVYPLCVDVGVLNAVRVRAEVGNCRRGVPPIPKPPTPKPPSPKPPSPKPPPPPKPPKPPKPAPSAPARPPNSSSPAASVPPAARAVPPAATRRPPRPSSPAAAPTHHAAVPKAARMPPRRKNPLGTLMVLVVITAVIAAGAGVAFAAAP